MDEKLHIRNQNLMKVISGLFVELKQAEKQHDIVDYRVMIKKWTNHLITSNCAESNQNHEWNTYDGYRICSYCECLYEILEDI